MPKKPTLVKLGRDCKSKMLICESRIEHATRLQMDNRCPCDSEEVGDLDVKITECRYILATLKTKAEGSPLWIAPLDSVDRLLSKGQNCIRDGMPRICNKKCVESCKTVRKLTHDCLEVSRSSLSSEENMNILKDLLREVHNRPRLVMCRCSSHMNSLTLSAYLHMSSSVISSLLQPLLSWGGTSSRGCDNCLLQEGSLHMAALKKNVSEAKEAIENGKRVNRLDATFNSALHIATILQHVRMAEFLLHSGADPNIANEDDLTPVLLATITQQKTLVELFSKKADLCKPNEHGLSPILVAMGLEDYEILEIMFKTNTTMSTYLEAIREEEIRKAEEKRKADRSKNMKGSTGESSGKSGASTKNPKKSKKKRK